MQDAPLVAEENPLRHLEHVRLCGGGGEGGGEGEMRSYARWVETV